MKIVSLLGCALLCACVHHTPLHDEIVWPLSQTQFNPIYWIQKTDQASTLRLTPPQINQFNQTLIAQNPTLHALQTHPDVIGKEEIEKYIRQLSQLPATPLFDHEGRALSATQQNVLLDNLNLDAITDNGRVRFGLVTQRTSLRRFSSDIRAFKTETDHDIDRFQESTLFTGDAVAVLHRSRDQQWYFVQSHNYRAWALAQDIALGDREAVLDYRQRTPAIIITAAKVQTPFTPENPAVSELVLEMGNRYPLIDSEETTINGQGSFGHHVIQLPARDADGNLFFTSALLPRHVDAERNYRPYTEATIIEQAFKFLGERYGWGHRYNARDCSGFVSDVYRSMGMFLPRNTGDQARNPSVKKITFDAQDNIEKRKAILRKTRVGDLVFIPGHVMMVIGHHHDEVFVIHDTTGIRLSDHNHHVKTHTLNGVYVTPLLALMADDRTPTIMTITTIEHLMPLD